MPYILYSDLFCGFIVVCGFFKKTYIYSLCRCATFAFSFPGNPSLLVFVKKMSMDTINLRQFWIFKWESNNTCFWEMCGVAVAREQCRESYMQFEKKRKKGKGKKNHKPYSLKHRLEATCLQTDGWGLGTLEVSKYNTGFLWQITAKQGKSQFPAHFILSNPIVKLHLQLTNIHSYIIIKLHLSFTAHLRLSSKTMILPAPVSHFNFVLQNLVEKISPNDKVKNL